MLDARFDGDRLDASALATPRPRRRKAPLTRRQFLALTAKAVGARLRPLDERANAVAPCGGEGGFARFDLNDDVPILRGGCDELLVALASAVESLDPEVMAWRMWHGERFAGNS